eukprot:2120233-Rhodomonas_salina.2
MFPSALAWNPRQTLHFSTAPDHLEQPVATFVTEWRASGAHETGFAPHAELLGLGFDARPPHRRRRCQARRRGRARVRREIEMACTAIR